MALPGGILRAQRFGIPHPASFGEGLAQEAMSLGQN